MAAVTNYILKEVDGVAAGEVLEYLNKQNPEFPELKRIHLDRGYWWLVRTWNKAIVGFAGMVQMIPFENVGYMKRAYISPAHRGNGLQLKLIKLREAKAREIGWTTLVSECGVKNLASQTNFLKSGFIECEPEQPWAADSVYFVKRLTA